MSNFDFAREIGVIRWTSRTAVRQFYKRVLRRDNRIDLPTKGTIILPRNSHNGTEVFVSNANIDWGAEAIFARFADPTLDAFDVGANIGYYSSYVAPLVRTVFAFEPDKKNQKPLQINADLAGNIIVIDKAVSRQTGVVHFADEEESEVSHVSSNGREVQSITLDDFTAECDARPCLIKIDVEGHDLAVVQGATEVMRKWQPLIVIEYNQGDNENDVGVLFDLCDQLGYAIWATTWSERKPIIARRSVRLVPMSRVSLFSFPTKMLFLVPSRLQEDFRSEAEALVAADR